jgi:hypothetical protein
MLDLANGQRPPSSPFSRQDIELVQAVYTSGQLTARAQRTKASLTVPTLCHHRDAISARLPVLLQECPDKRLKVLRRAERVDQDAEQLETKHEGVTDF